MYVEEVCTYLFAALPNVFIGLISKIFVDEIEILCMRANAITRQF
jgi:hypothetical protein